MEGTAGLGIAAASGLDGGGTGVGPATGGGAAALMGAGTGGGAREALDLVRLPEVQEPELVRLPEVQEPELVRLPEVQEPQLVRLPEPVLGAELRGLEQERAQDLDSVLNLAAQFPVERSVIPLLNSAEMLRNFFFLQKVSLPSSLTAALHTFLTLVLEVLQCSAYFVQQNQLCVGRKLLVFNQVHGKTVCKINVASSNQTFSQQSAEPCGGV